MGLHGMSHDDVGPSVLDDLSQCRNYFQIEPSALRNDQDFQTFGERRRDKFVWRAAARAFERND